MGNSNGVVGADVRSETVEQQRVWARQLLRVSPLKQRKLKMLRRFIGDTEGLTCLDIGADNGVISLLLREGGGLWWSVDLIPEAVAAIEQLVGERVCRINGEHTPFADNQFDLVVVVDFLEHIETDVTFVGELYRIIKPGGKLVVNVPNPKPGLLRKIQYGLGQTDEAHGHVRPGYSKIELGQLLNGRFKIEVTESYSRIFSVLIDTLITFGLDILKRGGRGRKGTVLTSHDLKKLKKSFGLYALMAPFILVFVRLDELFPKLRGNMLIARCQKL